MGSKLYILIFTGSCNRKPQLNRTNFLCFWIQKFGPNHKWISQWNSKREIGR